ncbi:serine/threonine-protein kinase [Paenibacillus donghaensis]|uniref:non-specific serine/threonine protein kinase n=1 Tax=Paenibacillus donghaensis TaxID=414771 RepID=A0A2Z2KFK1_9BACL|nr:serine/threonine-protein kinase [Paenibacillus donghaensis]ASA21890.1 hypothetical protein B9T62_14560 [Paenibacillus donghaensis]
MNYQSKLKAGQVLGERYLIKRLIGSGGMSCVYLAEDLRLPGKRWAVKENAGIGPEYDDMAKEAELLVKLSHARLPRVVDYCLPDADGYCYLIMDYIDGVTLTQYMQQHPGPLPGRLILDLARQLLEVLLYLHAQQPPIVYRDLKPANVMLSESLSLTLIDFGIARSYAQGSLRETVNLGTAGFAAPEQYEAGPCLPAVDQYGLGAVLLYMATGGHETRWRSGMEARLRPVVDHGLIPVIRRLLRVHPDDRYPDAAAVLEAVEQVRSHSDPHGARQKMRIQPPHRSGQQPPTVAAVLGAAPGLGATHTSLALSVYLSGLGPTAWVDMNLESPVHERLQQMFGEETELLSPAGSEGAAFSWQNIHFWRPGAEGSLTGVHEAGYTYVVLDLGTGEGSGGLQLFAASELPLLVASGADWRLEETLRWLRRCGLAPQPKWNIGLPLAGPLAQKLLQEHIGLGRVLELPFQRDPFQRKGKLAGALRSVVSGASEMNAEAVGRGFFKI